MALSEKREMTDALMEFENKLRAYVGIEEQLIIPNIKSMKTCITPLAESKSCQVFSDFTTAASSLIKCVTVSRMSEEEGDKVKNNQDETSDEVISSYNFTLPTTDSQTRGA